MSYRPKWRIIAITLNDQRSKRVMAWLRHLCWELRDFQWGLDYLK